MCSRAKQQFTSVLGTHGFSTEVAGRDRVLFFRRPVEARIGHAAYANMDTIHFASSAPTKRSLALGDVVKGTAASPPPHDTGPKKARPHHLPKLRRGSSTHSLAASRTKEVPQSSQGAATRDAGIQTMYRENDAQTEPFTPNYYIPEGWDPNPLVLGLSELGWNNGLPAGMEEVELIRRLQRRRALEASLPQGNDPRSREERFCALFNLERQEREEREQHMEKIRERRLDYIRGALNERERAREEFNRQRLEAIRTEKLKGLRHVLERSEAKRIAAAQQTLEGKTVKSLPSATRELHAVDPIETHKRKEDLIDLYAKHGAFGKGPLLTLAGPPAPVRQPSSHFRNYDVRPTMLSLLDGVQKLEKAKISRIQKMQPDAFVAPENYAVMSLPTLYQRREAKRVVDALEYVNAEIHKDAFPPEKASVLELYRATPRHQRPDTPELELEDDENEAMEGACILLQRLIRGRAVQNDFFDGKERCCGLIEELQAASNAKCAEMSPERKKEDEEIKRREAIAESFGDAAQGDVIVDTLDYLFNELQRRRELSMLESFCSKAEAMRAEREAKEAELRAHERILHDKDAIQYAAYIRAIDDVVECYTQQLYTTTAEDYAMEEAIDAECARLEEFYLSTTSVEAATTEDIVCNMLDSFLLPAVVDAVRSKPLELERKAPAAAACEKAQSLVPRDQ